ncbi:MAG: Stp1/IreP family PP2C-type Ser/Thr phosphatase [Blastocatellia bacterium AA13]|nr:MAG: Stp1/IreP family PP2C-type Ser/Thr phosphatase [Blastocatellia bacterium AA13]
MSDVLSQAENLCPNCSTGNEADATFCQGCGLRIDSNVSVTAPLTRPLPAFAAIAERYRIKSLLWSAPTYNAYSACPIDAGDPLYTIFERPLSLGDPFSGILGENGSDQSRVSQTRVEELLKEAGAALERFGILKPQERVVQDDKVYVVFNQVQAQPLAHLDQLGEKEVRRITQKLCTLAEQFHKQGWVYNGFEPYSIFLDHDDEIRLIGFDRARRIATRVEDAPIYPSIGYTAPEMSIPGAVYDPRFDVYSIGSVIQFLLTGERLGPGDGASLYPVATVMPNFERLLGRALAETPVERFQSAAELRTGLKDLNLPIVLQSGHFTDVGLVRELNEDSVLSLNLTQYFESVQTQIGLYVVSDGMGGEAAGEVASRVTVRAIAEMVTEKLISASLKSTHEEKIARPTHTGGLSLAVADGNDIATTELLRLAVINANREVLAYAKANPHERGLGATVTAAMIVGDVLSVAHVGDSRCYLLSGDSFEQLTEDHSLVQRMINTGSLSRSEARIHPYRNVIYRSIGADDQIEIDIIRRKLSSGDVVMLCSDGLNGMLSDDQIRDIMMVNSDPHSTAKELVVAANAAGGEDNTSVVVVRML